MSTVVATTLGGGPQPPAWEFILSHHQPNRFGRTLGVRWGGRTVHLCARCTGTLAGAGAYLLLFLASSHLPVPFFSREFQVLFALAPLPAAADWLTQSMGRRESTNAVRLVSGALLGMAYLDVLALLITRAWFFLLIAVLVFLAYAGALMLVLWVSGAYRQVVREHFPWADPDESG